MSSWDSSQTQSTAFLLLLARLIGHLTSSIQSFCSMRSDPVAFSDSHLATIRGGMCEIPILDRVATWTHHSGSTLTLFMGSDEICHANAFPPHMERTLVVSRCAAFLLVFSGRDLSDTRTRCCLHVQPTMARLASVLLLLSMCIY